jgi:hypothetical protein
LHPIQQTIHVAPADQLQSVHQIAERLLPAYSVDNGKVQLAGCTLEDRLFVRIEFRRGRQSGVVYLDDNGVEVAGELVEALGMKQTAQLARPPHPPGPQIEQVLGEAGKAVLERFSSGEPIEIVSAAALWCKYAEGKLRFAVGEESVELPFSGWSRTLRPPPFVCPYSGASTFHLAATDDGRIVAAEQIEPCAETRRRTLAAELVTCAVTGRRVMPELVETCPISGAKVLSSRMVQCGACRQRVSPATIRRGRCAACRDSQPAGKSEPRLARVLQAYPVLASWPSWRISETATVYVLTAAGWLRRLLLVVDKISLEPRHMATGNRALAGWRPLEPARCDHVLRG